MTKNPILGNGVERCGICGTVDDAEPCSCSTECGSMVPRDKIIDFRQRARELRIKGARKGAVSAFETSRALAVGMMHLNGEGVARDPSKGARFLETAAQGGSALARYELARLHIDGVAAPYDPDYAFKLLHMACDGEHVASMVYLAELYIFGSNCPKDIEAALELLYIAAGKNEPAAMYYLAFVYDKEPDYSNLFEAAYWYRRAAEYGHFKSQIRLASLYAKGQGVPLCLETAQAFLEVALESTREQDPRFLLWQGEHFAKEPETGFLAHALIKAAALMEHAPAQRSMLAHGWRA